MLDTLDGREKRLLALIGFAAMGLVAALTLSSLWFAEARRIDVPPSPEGLVARQVTIIDASPSHGRSLAPQRRGGAPPLGRFLTMFTTREYPRTNFTVIGGGELLRLDLPASAEVTLEDDPDDSAQAAGHGGVRRQIRVGGVRAGSETIVDAVANHRRLHDERWRREMWGWLFLAGALVPLAVGGLAGRRLLRG